jgi:UDP-N-acetylglucosamine diphosphorylase/glucosamine-1-phosphate N-acetyltransferase
MQHVIFEDVGHRSFGPLTVLRPTFDLRCGALLLREKLEVRRRGQPCLLVPRSGLEETVAEDHPGRAAGAASEEPTLALSSRVIVDDGLLDAIAGLPSECVLTSGGAPVGALFRDGVRDRVRVLSESGGDLRALSIDRSIEVPARVAAYPWDLVNLTPGEIAADAAAIGTLGTNEADVHPGAHAMEPARIALGAGTHVGPGAVLDARRGPIVIGPDVEILPNAYIAGPAAIGEGSVVRAGASIYGGTSIGPGCRLGGEIAESVLHSFANKQHGGFLGHSYVGSWVNLGAGTDNSDLKNNYGTVRVEIGGELIDTGSMFVGAVIGDHSKTAIGTRLNTGSVIGIFVNVLASGFPPKTIPSFAWGTQGGFAEYEIERAVETARRVMARRGAELTRAMEALIRRAHDDRR